MKQLTFVLLLIATFLQAHASADLEVRSIEQSELDMRCLFTDYERTERRFTLELSRDHKSLRVFYVDTTTSYSRKVFLARLKRYVYNPSNTHISMSFENPNQRGNVLYVALGVPKNISVNSGELAQHVVIHFSEGLYLSGRCHVQFK